MSDFRPQPETSDAKRWAMGLPARVHAHDEQARAREVYVAGECTEPGRVYIDVRGRHVYGDLAKLEI